eukprot:2777756-Heterocapsa_arctica.AAC.1
MKGSACCKLDEGKYKAVPNAGVFAHWRIANTAVELKLRRLGMMQAWASDPENHEHIIAAVFGKMKWEKEATYKAGEGVCMENANPWAVRAVHDFLSLAEVEDAQWLVGEVGRDILRLFSNRQLAKYFCSIDLSVLRKMLWARA